MFRNRKRKHVSFDDLVIVYKRKKLDSEDEKEDPIIKNDRKLFANISYEVRQIIRSWMEIGKPSLNIIRLEYAPYLQVFESWLRQYGKGLNGNALTLLGVPGMVRALLRMWFHEKLALNQNIRFAFQRMAPLPRIHNITAFTIKCERKERLWGAYGKYRIPNDPKGEAKMVEYLQTIPRIWNSDDVRKYKMKLEDLKDEQWRTLLPTNLPKGFSPWSHEATERLRKEHQDSHLIKTTDVRTFKVNGKVYGESAVVYTDQIGIRSTDMPVVPRDHLIGTPRENRPRIPFRVLRVQPGWDSDLERHVRYPLDNEYDWRISTIRSRLRNFELDVIRDFPSLKTSSFLGILESRVNNYNFKLGHVTGVYLDGVTNCLDNGSHKPTIGRKFGIDHHTKHDRWVRYQVSLQMTDRFINQEADEFGTKDAGVDVLEFFSLWKDKEPLECHWPVKVKERYQVVETKDGPKHKPTNNDHYICFQFTFQTMDATLKEYINQHPHLAAMDPQDIDPVYCTVNENLVRAHCR